MKRRLSVIIITLFVMVGKQANKANAQPNLGALRERFGKMENENLNKTYEGIVTSKGIEKDCSQFNQQELPPSPSRNAAETFLRNP